MPSETNNTPRRRAGSHFAPAGSADSATFAAAARRHEASRAASIRTSLPSDDAFGASETPRPIGVDPSETGAFARLSAGEGAVIATRATSEQAASAARTNLETTGSMRIPSSRLPKVKRRHTRIKTDKRLFLGLAVAALAVIAVLGFVFGRAYDSTSTQQVASEQASQTQVAADGSVALGDLTYALAKQPDGKYALTRKSSSSAADVVFEIDGTPKALVLFNGAFFIPEDLSDGTWDVVAYMVGDGSVQTQLSDSSGNAIKGSGTVSSAQLADGRLTLVDSEGKSTSVPLS